MKRGKELSDLSSFGFCLLVLCKNAPEEAFKVNINQSHHPKEEVSSEPSQEKEKYSDTNHLNHYWYHSCRYIGPPSTFVAVLYK